MSANLNFRRSVVFSEQTIKQLDLLATKEHISTAELIRRYVDKGMSLDKTKDDIDFIRKNIREEIELQLKPDMERIISG